MKKLNELSGLQRLAEAFTFLEAFVGVELTPTALHGVDGCIFVLNGCCLDDFLNIGDSEGRIGFEPQCYCACNVRCSHRGTESPAPFVVMHRAGYACRDRTFACLIIAVIRRNDSSSRSKHMRQCATVDECAPRREVGNFVHRNFIAREVGVAVADATPAVGCII